jgi:hypothetical protein
MYYTSGESEVGHMFRYDGTTRSETLVYIDMNDGSCLFVIIEASGAQHTCHSCDKQATCADGSSNKIYIDCTKYEDGAIASECSGEDFGVQQGGVLEGFPVSWSGECFASSASANTSTPTQSSP